MFFKFDSLSGRVVPSTTSSKVYNPAGLTPAATDVPKQPVFMFESSKVKAASIDVVADAALSGHSTGKALGTFPADAGYGKVLALQKKWAADDGLMVWQKRGFRDSGPYYINLVGIAVGVTYSFYLIYKMSFPKRQE